MFETAVAVGLYHKSDNTIDINPDETKVFKAGDQIVALSTSGYLFCFAPDYMHPYVCCRIEPFPALGSIEDSCYAVGASLC